MVWTGAIEEIGWTEFERRYAPLTVADDTGPSSPAVLAWDDVSDADPARLWVVTNALQLEPFDPGEDGAASRRVGYVFSLLPRSPGEEWLCVSEVPWPEVCAN